MPLHNYVVELNDVKGLSLEEIAAKLEETFADRLDASTGIQSPQNQGLT